MTSRKDFVAIAKILKEHLDDKIPFEVADRTIVGKFVGYFESDNPNFDADKFRKACGVL